MHEVCDHDIIKFRKCSCRSQMGIKTRMHTAHSYIHKYTHTCMLKGMFSQQRGPRYPVVLEGMNWWDDIPKEFVQIMFDRTPSHWICVSNKMSDDNAVEIFHTAALSSQVICLHTKANSHHGKEQGGPQKGQEVLQN